MIATPEVSVIVESLGSMHPIYKPVVDRFEHLPDGDRSCVVAVLDNAGTEQLISTGSAHDQFYEALRALRWTQGGTPELAAVTNIAEWSLTVDEIPDRQLFRTRDRLRVAELHRRPVWPEQ